MKLRPDGQLFLVQHFPGHHQQTIDGRSQQAAPALANHCKLIAQRARGRERRHQQQPQQVHGASVRNRNERPRREVLRQALRGLAVNGVFGKRGVVKQLHKGLKGRIAIGHPEQNHLFKGHVAVRYAVGGAGEPLLRRLLAAINGDARVMLHKSQQQLFDLFLMKAAGQPGQPLGHDLRIILLAILGHERMAGLINEAHGIESGGVNALLGVALHIAHLIHTMGKLAARRQAGKYDIPVE